MHWFGRSDIMLRQVIVAVSLCSVLVVCVCVCGFGSDIGLCWPLVAVSLCSVSVVCVCIGLGQISGFVGYL